MRAVMMCVFLSVLILPTHVCYPAWKDTPHRAIDGDAWNKMALANKVWWLQGYREGLPTAGCNLVSDEKNRPELVGKACQELYPYALNDYDNGFKNTISALDKFYSDYKNLKIPVVSALELITAEMSGKSKEEIEKRKEKLRFITAHFEELTKSTGK